MSLMEQHKPRARRSFSPEFKRDAVSMVVNDDRTIVDVADSFGIGDGTLGTWVRQARVDAGDNAGVTVNTRDIRVRVRNRDQPAAQIAHFGSIHPGY